ncbi:MAG: hypothetical protein NC250_09615, partial [Alistipes senegalensis]|nr:hypothetical protein [Alistipes senegalensis]
DTRIFSPLLYQLSYGTITDREKNAVPSLHESGIFQSWCKGNQNFRKSKYLVRFFRGGFPNECSVPRPIGRYFDVTMLTDK